MPRVAQQPTTLNAKNPLLANHPNVLKRNQACHQCRRRKLKCDAKRPCSTCVRSHTHALAHAAPGTILPPNPECTFDEIAETAPSSSEGPKSKYEKLENRIGELEALLRQSEGDTDATNQVGTSYGSNHTLNSPASLASSSQLTSLPSGTGVQTSDGNSNIDSTAGLDLLWSKWPSSLPNSELLHHLIDVFFMFHPHANRLFHIPTFLHSLALSPTHPKFPALPVLHAICAIGSLYTAAVTSPLPLDEIPADEIFLERIKLKEQRPDSFAEIHAKLAKESADRCYALGENLFQVLQANIILTWFYWSHSNWVGSFFSSAHSMRLAVPLGLNMCPPFHTISNTDRPISILPPARTVIEDEMRRNAFWLAYATERQHGMGNGWTLSLDDQDVSQLLPVRGDQFVNGTLVSPSERQWGQSPELLLVHPEPQVDSFILYIKGCILISKVKLFNLRYRTKYFAGDPSVANVYDDNLHQDTPADPRGSTSFVELDHIASSFSASFPVHLRNPIDENVLDSHLYTACLMPLVATIMLHDPHAEVRQSGCLSALKILSSARAILDLIHAVQSTSYDITLLDTFCIFCWFTCGRVLLRFLRTAIAAQSTEQISTLQTEVEYVRAAIAKVGERIPLAYRYAKMLENLLIEYCGSVSQPVQLTFPCPLDMLVMQPLFAECSASDSADNRPDVLLDPGSYLSLSSVLSTIWGHRFDIVSDIDHRDERLQEKNMNEQLKVAILGPLGTYTHEAALKVFGAHGIYDEHSSISGVFESVSKGIALGVVPQENSIFGTVTETYDRLRNTSGFICGQITIKIEHSLLVKQGVQIHQIQRVFSHEQALGQCQTFLKTNLPGVVTIQTPSTAAAARALLDEPPDCGAICSTICGQLYEGLDVLYTGIQDVQSNSTQFYILSNRDTDLPQEVSCDFRVKALIRMSAPRPSCQSDSKQNIVPYLMALDLPSAHISRRPSLVPIPFYSVYFVEAFGRHDQTRETWKVYLEEAMYRVRALGCEVDLIGVW